MASFKVYKLIAFRPRAGIASYIRFTLGDSMKTAIQYFNFLIHMSIL